MGISNFACPSQELEDERRRRVAKLRLAAASQVRRVRCKDGASYLVEDEPDYPSRDPRGRDSVLSVLEPYYERRRKRGGEIQVFGPVIVLLLCGLGAVVFALVRALWLVTL